MLIIDRFEGEFALLEADGEMLRLRRSLLPKDAREGDCLTIGVDREQTEIRRNALKRKFDSMFDE